MSCPVRIRVWPKDDGIFDCRLEGEHVEHEATGLFEYQVISWMDGDRRQFVGEFVECTYPSCLLPMNHHGNHA